MVYVKVSDSENSTYTKGQYIAKAKEITIYHWYALPHKRTTPQNETYLPLPVPLLQLLLVLRAQSLTVVSSDPDSRYLLLCEECDIKGECMVI